MVTVSKYLSSFFKTGVVGYTNEITFSQAICIGCLGLEDLLIDQNKLSNPEVNISQKRGVAIHEICEQFPLYAQPTLSDAFKALNQKGLVTKHVDENDGRVSRFELTPFGKAVEENLVLVIQGSNTLRSRDNEAVNKLDLKTAFVSYLNSLCLVQELSRREEITFSGANILLYLGYSYESYLRDRKLSVKSAQDVAVQEEYLGKSLVSIRQGLLCYTTSTLSEALAQLNSLSLTTGMVNPQDRRSKYFHLTVNGKVVYNRLKRNLRSA